MMNRQQAVNFIMDLGVEASTNKDYPGILLNYLMLTDSLRALGMTQEELDCWSKKTSEEIEALLREANGNG